MLEKKSKNLKIRWKKIHTPLKSFWSVVQNDVFDSDDDFFFVDFSTDDFSCDLGFLKNFIDPAMFELIAHPA